MTVIFVITKGKDFYVIEETAQTMCMDFVNDTVCVIDQIHTHWARYSVRAVSSEN